MSNLRTIQAQARRRVTAAPSDKLTKKDIQEFIDSHADTLEDALYNLIRKEYKIDLGTFSYPQKGISVAKQTFEIVGVGEGLDGVEGSILTKAYRNLMTYMHVTPLIRAWFGFNEDVSEGFPFPYYVEGDIGLIISYNGVIFDAKFYDNYPKSPDTICATVDRFEFEWDGKSRNVKAL